MSLGVAAGAGPPRVMSPDRLMEYSFDTSLAWVVRGIKTRRRREGWFGWWVNLIDGVNQIETETDGFSTCIRRMHRGELSNQVLLLCFGVRFLFFSFLFLPFFFFSFFLQGLPYGGLFAVLTPESWGSWGRKKKKKKKNDNRYSTYRRNNNTGFISLIGEWET